jgi:hypothetical protein
VGAQQASETVLIKRIAPAGIPRGKAHKRVQEAERNGQGHRFDVGNFVKNCEEISQQARDRNPGEQVNHDAPRAAEDRVHIRA